MRDILLKAILPLMSLVPITSFAASYYGSAVYSDIGAGIRYDSNVGRSQQASDRKEDFITNINARLGYQRVLSQNSLFNISSDIAFERMAEFKALNNLQLGVTASYYTQPVTGFFQPWAEAKLRLSHLNFNKSKIREGFIVDASVKVGKRLTNKTSAWIAYHYNERYSDEKVFDLVNHVIETDIEYRYSREISLFAGYNVNFGEVVSTAIPNANIIAVAESVAADDVFFTGLGPGCANRRCAYRLDATSHKLNAGINMNVGDSAELELATQYHHTNAKGDNRYQGLIYHASVWYAF